MSDEFLPGWREPHERPHMLERGAPAQRRLEKWREGKARFPSQTTIAGRVVHNRKLHPFKMSDVERILKKIPMTDEEPKEFFLRWYRILWRLIEIYDEKMRDYIERAWQWYFRGLRRAIDWLIRQMYRFSWDWFGLIPDPDLGAAPGDPRGVWWWPTPYPVSEPAPPSEVQYDADKDFLRTVDYILEKADQLRRLVYGEIEQEGQVPE